MNDYIVLPSMDADPGDTFPNSRFSNIKGSRWICNQAHHLEQYQNAVTCLLELFDALPMKGKMTWVLNQRDVNWARHYRSLIQDMTAAGYEIGLHTHVGAVYQKIALESPALKAKARLLMKEAKERVEDCVGQACVSHRFGCYHQETFFYAILKQLDIKIVSDVNPGVFLRDLEGHILDDAAVPYDASPWQHDEHNWLDYKSRQGHFLHVPVCAAGLGGDDFLAGRQAATLDGRPIRNIAAVDAAAEKAKQYGIRYVCWHMHPHEIQNLDGSVNADKVKALWDCLEKLHDELHPRYMNFRELLTQVMPAI